jgi:hypothetical protein
VDSVPLYPVTSNGFLNTIFTGAQYVSAGGGIDGGGKKHILIFSNQF